MNPQTLDLQLPIYLRAGDLSQRIARDAGLQAFWPDRTRKLYSLRARGRLLQPNETLGDLRVVNNELIYILPQLRPNTPLREQNPDFPKETVYAAGAISILLSIISFTMMLSVGWGLALVESSHWMTLLLPPMGMGVFCCSFARHAWGGKAMRAKVIGSAAILYVMSLFPCIFVALFVVDDVGAFIVSMIPGTMTGLIGLLLSWLSWWGAVESLPKREQVIEQEEEAVKQNICGICGGAVSDDVLVVGVHQCPHLPSPPVFHKGCYTASASVYRGPEGFCHVCKTKM
ncbi:MAG: hypothetical protein VX278_01710 [Myxococcota bacterium]|nr:hypothetical protein [Myxococcota bacterium]